MRVLLRSCVILVHIASLFNQQASASDSDSGSDNGSKSVNIGTPERKLMECVDDPVEWFDSDGPVYDCAWYGAVSSHCTSHGNSYANFGRTANEACCVCRGRVSPAVEVLGDCARDQSCDSPATNTAVTWFTNPDNHLVDDDDDWDDQVWRERLVLAIFYYEMSGDQWYDNTNWLTPSHHRLWYGVGYTNYVDELDLNSNNLIGSIPAQISILTSLTYLSFSNKKRHSCISLLLFSTAIEVLGECAIDQSCDILGECVIEQSCDSPETNSAVKWFIDPDNHPDDLGTDEQVWKERLVLAVFYYSTGGDFDSPSLLSKKVVDMFGECAIDQSCDSTTANKAVKWFIDPENHPDDLGTDEQVWKERIVLAIFFYSTGGDQWSDSTNWLDANDHSTWYKVTTDSSTNYVQKLYLWINALSGTIPAEIGNLTSLTDLVLHGNDLSGSIPAEIGDLTSLTKLSLYTNFLSGTIPPEIGHLTSLTQLYLSWNDLTGSVPDDVCDVPPAYLYADCEICNQSKPDCCNDCT